MMNTILLVEDDAVIANGIKNHLVAWGYEVVLAQEFHDILPLFTQTAPLLVLLDISLPFYGGYHWCGEIRKRSQVPIIFLSSVADNMNIIMAMNMGADDFIPKPFDLNVLTAKIQAVMRRTYDFKEEPSVLEHGGVLLNLGTACLEFGGAKSELTKNDFRILEILMERAGHVVSREDIMERLWESDSFIDDNTLTVNMTRLRKKLEDIGLHEFILTKKRLGYIVP